ncbi:MAG: 5'/3'-nucleotidase SurE [Calditrichia bacterium]
MSSDKPLILVTNDDGIHAPGILALARAMESLGDVKVVAPDSEKSAVGHAITITDPLRVWEFEREGRFFGYAVNGTPADCVKLAAKALLPRIPDLVVSGINQGPNTAMNVMYSGTVSAATEGTLMGIPSIAFSLTSFKPFDFSPSATFARHLAEIVLQNGLPDGTLLNVNIPPRELKEIKGVKFTRQGKGRYEELFDKRIDPWNRTYYWLSGKRLFLDSEPDVDDVAVMDDYIAITPIQFDLTDYKLLDDLKSWKVGLPDGKSTDS